MGTRKTAGFLLAVVAGVAPITAVAAEDDPPKPRRISFESEGEIAGLDCVVTGVGTGTKEPGRWATIELDVHFSCPATLPVPEGEVPAG